MPSKSVDFKGDVAVAFVDTGREGVGGVLLTVVSALARVPRRLLLWPLGSLASAHAGLSRDALAGSFRAA